jgi:uncharacterized membrane protein YidH (DUF202 family)
MTTDAGLQRERTTLAWHRTALALLGLGLVTPRVAWPVFGAWSLLPAAAMAVAAGVLALAGRRTFPSRAVDGRLPLLTTLAALLLALVAAVLVVWAA